jgi:hypothetical protein
MSGPRGIRWPGRALEKKDAETVAASRPCRDFVAFPAEESWLNAQTFSLSMLDG